MTRLPMVSVAEMIRALKKAGFVEHTQKGSHLVLKNYQTGRRTGVAVHRKDIGRGLLKSILKQAGLSESEFHKLL